MNDDARQVLTLVKGAHRFVFSYAVGQEPAVLEALMELALSPDSGIDWFDAVVLHGQLERIRRQEMRSFA